MSGRVAPVRESPRSGRRPVTVRCLLVFVSVFVPSVAGAQLNTCDRDANRIADAITRIKNSIDPCGRSAEVLEVLDQVESCVRTVYELCTDPAAARNVFDRPVTRSRDVPPRTITWNPDLRTELEPACAADPSESLRRDPTASLLHELVHAAQDCRGLNPGEHELDAVRIENIYRRSAGLCERSGYGDTALPSSMASECAVQSCSCSGDHLPGPLPVQQVESASVPRIGVEGTNGDISGDRPILRSPHPRPDGKTIRPRREAAPAVGG